MTKRLGAAVAILVFCMLMAAQQPVVDIDKRVHPNLAAAQQHIVVANRYIATAQKDNRYDMQGHAEKARQLLMQADQELKAAAAAANSAGKRR